MIRRPPRSTLDRSSAASDVYKRQALWINPNNTNQLYLGTDGGVYISLDKGATWSFVQSLPVGQFYHAAVDDRKPYNICLLYTSPSPRDRTRSRMPSSA